MITKLHQNCSRLDRQPCSAAIILCLPKWADEDYLISVESIGIVSERIFHQSMEWRCMKD